MHGKARMSITRSEQTTTTTAAAATTTATLSYHRYDPKSNNVKVILVSSLLFRVFRLFTCSSLTIPDEKSLENDEEELHY